MTDALGDEDARNGDLCDPSLTNGRSHKTAARNRKIFALLEAGTETAHQIAGRYGLAYSTVMGIKHREWHKKCLMRDGLIRQRKVD